MNVTSYPIKPIKSEKLTLTSASQTVSTKSQPCLLTVKRGNVFLAGKRDEEASSDGFAVPAGEILRLFGDFKLCSDSSGADVRILYYDVI